MMTNHHLRIGTVLLGVLLATAPVAVTQVQAGLTLEAARSMRSFRRADPSFRARYNKRSLESRLQYSSSTETTHEMRSRSFREAKLRLIQAESIERGLDNRAYKTQSRLERRKHTAEQQKGMIPRSGGVLKNIRLGSSTSTQREAKHISDMTRTIVDDFINTCSGTSSRRRSACETIQRRKVERIYRR